MTRTERSHSLRALVKDRSEARNGMDSSVPKGGAGAHNWGSIHSEYDLENAAIVDEADESEDQVQATSGGASGSGASQSAPKKPAVVRRTSSITDEDRENALKLRKNAFKGNGEIDLSDIARSSVALCGSPTKENAVTSTF